MLGQRLHREIAQGRDCIGDGSLCQGEKYKEHRTVPCVTGKEFIGNDVYIYGYNDLGNITSIKKATRSGSVTSTSYTGADD